MGDENCLAEPSPHLHTNEPFIINTSSFQEDLRGLKSSLNNSLGEVLLAQRESQNSDLFDIERNNASIVLESMQLGEGEQNGPWMYCQGDNPFNENCSQTDSVYAHSTITSNLDGRGDGTCQGDGNGRMSRGYLDPFHFYLQLNRSVDFAGTRASLRGLRLSNFSHINTVDEDKAWNTLGQGGDSRVYINGTFELVESDRILLLATSVRWFQNLSYPQPAGEASTGSQHFSGYFVGEIVDYSSNDWWVRALDPFGTGYLLGVIRAAAFGPRSCYAIASFWITLRGFPDLGVGTYSSTVVQNNTANTGAKVGPYLGSNAKDVQRARDLADVSIKVVMGTFATVAVGAISATAVTVLLPVVSTTTMSTPGNGASRMIRNAAFIARFSEIRGFHTDTLREFGSNLKPFLVKFPFPFDSPNEAPASTENKHLTSLSLEHAWATASGWSTMEGESILRQEEGEENNTNPSVTDSTFKGCAFYTLLSVAAVLSIHACIWLATRHRSLEDQVGPHAWMVYIFSLVMEYVHISSILNALQYARSHVGRGTGKTTLYAVAALQFTVIGIGFLVFFTIVIAMAFRRMSLHNVEWIPRRRHPDPTVRMSAFILGEYQANDDNLFHGIFEGYYSGLAGPRIWIATIEISAAVVDAVATALIWDEVGCLATMFVAHGIVVLLFIIFSPFVDTIEGRLVTAIGLTDVLLLLLELLSALGSYNTADRIDNIAIVLASISIGIGALITLYCDIIPMSQTVWEWVGEWVWACLRLLRLVKPDREESVSTWSVLTGSLSDYSENGHRGDVDSEGTRMHRDYSGDYGSDSGGRTRGSMFSFRPNIGRNRRRANAWTPLHENDGYMETENAITHTTGRNSDQIGEPSRRLQPGQTIDNYWTMMNSGSDVDRSDSPHYSPEQTI